MSFSALLFCMDRSRAALRGFSLALGLTLPSFVLAQTASPQPPDPIPDHAFRGQISEIARSVAATKAISQAVISPDGKRFVYAVAGAGQESAQELFVGIIAQPDSTLRISTLRERDRHTACREAEPMWSPDGSRLAFLSDCNSLGQMQLFLADSAHPDSAPKRITNLTGYLSRPKWAPDGKTIAVLFVDHASRAPNPLAAGNPQTGVIDDLQQLESQRIALINPESQEVRLFTPPALTIFEYDWAHSSRSIAYTAAPPPGDDNWYIAELYTQALAEFTGHSIYKPQFQMALPRWSPDGKSIAFIAGLMSDEGATGGELYLLPSTGGEPRDLTPDRKSSPAWFQFFLPDTILFTEYAGGSVAISTLDLRSGKIEIKWQGGESIHASAEESSLSVASSSAVLVRESWTQPAEVWAGPIGKWTQVTHINVHAADAVAPSRVENMTWQNDGFQIQGWLLFPQRYDPRKQYPMLVSAHGGPAWIQVPSVASIDFQVTSFTRLGYFVFLPNPRGSFGQGEKFTQANRREWGFGDVSDTVAGVDAVTAQYPVDARRVGIIGWSYGASTAMMAVGRTGRFRAAVAGAGASNLLSYYGQNQIDKWMHFYYGESAYDDPAAYMRNSAISYVRQVKTPTLLVVGERDEEAPPPQSFEFWHALKELGTPTQLVVYPGEGHSFEKYENRVDLMERAADWFAKYMPESGQQKKAP